MAKKEPKNELVLSGKKYEIASIAPEALSGIQRILSDKVAKKGMIGEAPPERIQYARIYQPTSSLSREGAYANINLGDLYIDKPLGDNLTVYPLIGWYSRAKWEQEGNDRFMDCQSPDGVSPVDPKYAKKCGQCHHSRGSKQSPSACTRVCNILVVDSTFSEVYTLQFSKSSAKAGDVILNLANSGDDDAPFFHTSFSVKTKKDDKMPFYKFITRADSPCAPDLYPALLAIQDKYMVLVQSQITRLSGAAPIVEEEVKKEADPVEDDGAEDNVPVPEID